MAAACTQKEQNTYQNPSQNTPSQVNNQESQINSAPPRVQSIPQEVRDLLGKSSKVENVYYKYRGPETGTNFFEFYVKGDMVKYLPARQLKALDQPDSYDSIIINKTAKTAASYCLGQTCVYKGKKGDLSYSAVYVPTIYDWFSSLKKAEKVGEEVIDDRKTWKLDTDQGFMWVDYFYGIPLKIDSNGHIYRFEQLNVKGVADSDVNPS